MRCRAHRGLISGALAAAALCCRLPAAAAAEAVPPEACAALEDGLHELAAKHLTAYLVRNRDRPRDCVPALLLLCQALAAQGRPADLLAALEAWPEVVAAGGDEGGFDFWRARALLDAGRPREALDVVARAPLERLAEEYASGLRRVAARALLALGDRQGARALFAGIDAVATNQALKAGNLLEWARLEMEDGNAGECAALLGRLPPPEAADGEAAAAVEAGILLHAQARQALGRPGEAADLLRRLATNTAAGADARAEAWSRLAELAAAAGRTNEVIEAGCRALQLCESPAQAWRTGMRQGRLLLELPGRVGEGAALLKRMIRERPDDPAAAAAQMALAQAWLAAGSNAQAAAEFQIHLETYGDPEHLPAALRGKALALSRLGAHDEAAATFQKAADLATNAAERAACLLGAADALHAGGRFGQAAALYAQVAAAADAPAPLAADAAFMAADALERLGRNDEAEAAFALLAERAPADLAEESLLRLGALRERRQDIEGAIAAYDRVLGTATNAFRRGQALLGRGRARYRSYRFETAIEDFVRARRDFPDVAAEAAYLHAMALYGAGRDEEARKVAEEFERLYPEAPQLAEVHLWMGKHSYNRQDFAEARRLLTNFAARWPRHQWADAALLWAGRAAFRQADYPAAIEILSRLPRDYPRSPFLAEARFVQAEALGEQARFEEAILVLDEIINRHAESEWVVPAWLRKGDSLYALGSDAPARYEEALRAYAVAESRPDGTPELSLQAAYKSGRCLERLGRLDEALERYHGVVTRFQRERRAGVWHGTPAIAWVARAGVRAAELLEARGETEAAIRVLRRVEAENPPGVAEIRARIERLQAARRWQWPPLRRPATAEETKP